MEAKQELFAVMVQGKNLPQKLHNNKTSALIEAGRLCLIERQPVYMLKAIALVEVKQVKITDLE